MTSAVVSMGEKRVIDQPSKKNETLAAQFTPSSTRALPGSSDLLTRCIRLRSSHGSRGIANDRMLARPDMIVLVVSVPASRHLLHAA